MLNFCSPVLDAELVIFETRGSKFQIPCNAAAASKEAEELNVLTWYKDEEEIVVWDRATNTPKTGSAVSSPVHVFVRLPVSSYFNHVKCCTRILFAERGFPAGFSHFPTMCHTLAVHLFY